MPTRVAYEWTVFATMATLVVAVVGLLATALFQQGAKIDRLADRIDQRFERIDQRLERIDQRFERIDQRFERIEGRLEAIEARMKEAKAELLGRLDVLAERITRLEAS